MIAELSRLADHIGALREFSERCNDTTIKAIAAELASHFAWVMDALTEHQGVLDGDMPWWTERADKLPD